MYEQWALSKSRCWMEPHFSHVVDVVVAVVVIAVVDVTAVVTIHGGRQIIRESPFSSSMYYFCIATISCWTKFALLLKQFFPVRSLPRTELSLGMLMPHPKVRERAFSYFKVTFNFFIVVEEWKEECEPKRVYRNVSFSKCPNCRESPGQSPFLWKWLFPFIVQMHWHRPACLWTRQMEFIFHKVSLWLYDKLNCSYIGFIMKTETHSYQF